MRQRLPLILSITALVVALLGWTGVGEATRNAFVPKNSVGSAQIKNRSIKFVDLSLNARFKLARDARVGPGGGSNATNELRAYKTCVNKYLNDVSAFLNGTRQFAPSYRTCF